jgi:hypothetical protein
MGPKTELQAVAQVIERLEHRFPSVPPLLVEKIVHEEHHALDGRPVRAYVSVLVEHGAKKRIRAQLARPTR